MIPTILDEIDLTELEIKDVPNLTFQIEGEDNNRLLKALDGEEAIRQAVRVMLSVERYDYEIYPRWFGFELKSLIGEPMWYAQAVVVQKIKECLLMDDRIEDVTDFDVKKDGRKLNVSFVVKTNRGNLEESLEVEV